MKDLKYLTAFIIPVMAIVGLSLRGYWSFLTPVVGFILVPILETLMPVNTRNLSESEASSKAKNVLFDMLLYLNVPLIFGLVGWFLWSLSWAEYSTMELIGLTFSLGVAMGSNGINVAHELGHRENRWEKTLGKLLLIPTLNMHFYVEHNFGHHVRVGTAEDPASAKYNQSVYAFWFVSIPGQYVSAWQIQKDLLQRKGAGFFSVYNDMLWYTIFQLVYLAAVWFFYGSTALIIALVLSVTAILLLETINYIEHYGLSRSKTESGRYERVQEIHSWNSNHVLGRMMLYELTRHSDHHHRASKKYQLLDYHEISPQLPYGYPTSMVLAMVPPLWFTIMNKRIPIEMRT